MCTIRSSKEIDAVFRSARRVSHPLLIALVAQTPPGRGHSGRVAFIAGKRMGGAVVRNRAKRVMRAAAARAHGPWPGYDVLLVARPATARAGAAELDAALASLVRRSGIQ